MHVFQAELLNCGLHAGLLSCRFFLGGAVAIALGAVRPPAATTCASCCGNRRRDHRFASWPVKPFFKGAYVGCLRIKYVLSKNAPIVRCPPVFGCTRAMPLEHASTRTSARMCLWYVLFWFVCFFVCLCRVRHRCNGFRGLESAEAIPLRRNLWTPRPAREASPTEAV